MVTVVITACDRVDLLERTLRSFLKFNTYPIKKFIIRDDSGLFDVFTQTMNLVENLEDEFDIGYKFTFDYKVGQLGQAKSIDRLMDMVKTPFVFHLEDDWEFFEEGFIQRGLEYLKEDVTQVRFRDRDDNLQGIEITPGIMELNNHKFSFNPHLRKMSDYSGYEGKNETELGRESKRSIWIKGVCRHIGGGKPTNRPGTPYHKGVKKA